MEENTIQTQEMKINPQAASTLAEGAKWAGIMANIMYVLIAFVVLALIGILFSPMPAKGMFVVIYGFCLVLYIVFARMLSRFKSKTVAAVANADGDGLAEGFGALRDYFKWSVIITLIAFGLAILGGIIAGISGISMVSGMM